MNLGMTNFVTYALNVQRTAQFLIFGASVVILTLPSPTRASDSAGCIAILTELSRSNEATAQESEQLREQIRTGHRPTRYESSHRAPTDPQPKISTDLKTIDTLTKLFFRESTAASTLRDTFGVLRLRGALNDQPTWNEAKSMQDTFRWMVKDPRLVRDLDKTITDIANLGHTFLEEVSLREEGTRYTGLAVEFSAHSQLKRAAKLLPLLSTVIDHSRTQESFGRRDFERLSPLLIGLAFLFEAETDSLNFLDSHLQKNVPEWKREIANIRKSLLQLTDEHSAAPRALQLILADLRSLAVPVALPTYRENIKDRLRSAFNSRGAARVDSQILRLRKRALEPIYDNALAAFSEYGFLSAVADSVIQGNLPMSFATMQDANVAHLRIHNGHHPFQILNSPNNSVANSIELSHSEPRLPHMQLLSGRNWGGKSTYLKMVAFNVYLATIGFPVFAQAMEIAPLNLYAHVSINENEGVGESLARAQLRSLADIKQIVETSTLPSLVILDEFFNGTLGSIQNFMLESFLKSVSENGSLGLVVSQGVEVTQSFQADPIQLPGLAHVSNAPGYQIVQTPADIHEIYRNFYDVLKEQDPSWAEQFRLRFQL